jgi:hypothetical protein
MPTAISLSSLIPAGLTVEQCEAVRIPTKSPGHSDFMSPIIPG